jgi:hypothetical protein
MSTLTTRSSWWSRIETNQEIRCWGGATRLLFSSVISLEMQSLGTGWCLWCWTVGWCDPYSSEHCHGKILNLWIGWLPIVVGCWLVLDVCTRICALIIQGENGSPWARSGRNSLPACAPLIKVVQCDYKRFGACAMYNCCIIKGLSSSQVVVLRSRFA